MFWPLVIEAPSPAPLRLTWRLDGVPEGMRLRLTDPAGAAVFLDEAESLTLSGRTRYVQEVAAVKPSIFGGTGLVDDVIIFPNPTSGHLRSHLSLQALKRRHPRGH